MRVLTLVLCCAIFCSPSGHAQAALTTVDTPLLTSVIEASDGNSYGVSDGGTQCGDFAGAPCGAIYRIDRTGASSVLFDFSSVPNQMDGGGISPLVEGQDGALYGVTAGGGDPTCLCGVFFKITLAGALTVLHTFMQGDFGSNSSNNQYQAPITLGNDGNFYGVSFFAIYRLTPAGQVTLLHDFQAAPVSITNGLEPSGLSRATMVIFME